MENQITVTELMSLMRKLVVEVVGDKLDSIQAELKAKHGTSARDVLAFSEACEYLGVKATSLRTKMHKHELPYYKPNGGKVYFRRDDLNKFLLKGRVDSQAEIEQMAEAHIAQMKSNKLKTNKE